MKADERSGWRSEVGEARVVKLESETSFIEIKK
jgi:hypothetical protein